jgi:serine acetyltransferase
MDHGGGGGGIWIRAAVAVAAGGAIAARAVRRKSVDFSAVYVGVPAMVAHTIAGHRSERRFSSLRFRRKGSPLNS